jgi:asparagine synthase (glutamine-hydrolysing)
MCGIVGAVGLRTDLGAERAETILEAIRHRGPDWGDHTFVNGVWLGSRRLKILDLRDEANQPMGDAATGIVLVYNGEIYNYVELRAELEAKDHRFATSGDTEVLLRGYLEWGDDLFVRCNGMWALAIYDPRRRGVVLSRDRFGEKPLYVGRDAAGVWWFGSETQALRTAGAGSGRFDRGRILNFLAFGDAEDPTGSFYDGIEQLPPAHSALLTETGPTDVRRWWDLASAARESWSSTPSADSDGDLLAAIDQAVRIRLRSDVSVGSSLSGGVDSSTILASIRQAEPSIPLHVFTASFPGREIDEWDRAKRVADLFSATAHRVEPTAEGLIDELPNVVRHQGGPFDSPSVYAQWCVMRRAAEEGVIVLLDGQGADETWGGYSKYVWFGVAEALRCGNVRGAAQIVRRWRAEGDLPLPDPMQVTGLALPTAGRLAARRLLRATQRWIGPALKDATPIDPQGRKVGGPLLRQAAIADAERVVLPRLLRYADRNSMAWSRELRLPFLDEQIVRTAFASGWRTGLEHGWTKERLRRLAAERIPADVAWRRPKTAYDIPAEWLAHVRVREEVRASFAFLREQQLLAGPAHTRVSPWRALTLARFLEQSRLTA